MMKKIFGFATLVCMLLFSCNQDGLNNDNGGADSSVLSVTFKLNDIDAEVATRTNVDPVGNEQNVNSIYLFFFEASESQTGIFVDYIKVDASLAPFSMNAKYTLQTTGTTINVANAYNIVAVANIDDNHYISGNWDAWSASWTGHTEAYFHANAMAEILGVASETNNARAIDSGWILMNGSTTKKAMSGDITLALTRNMVRFDVTNNVDATHDLVTVSIWNAHTQSSITGDGVVDYSMNPGLRTTRFYGITNRRTASVYNKEIKGGLYAFENQVSSPAIDDLYTTCLIIGLSEKSSDAVSYYRVNMHPIESAQNLKRNNVYKVSINGVRGTGAATETDAYAGTNSELIFAINNWDLDDNGMIVSDMYSILAVPVKTIKIGANGGDFSYTITTFSTLTSPVSLAMKSQTYNPSTGDIKAVLNGSNLTLIAQPLGSDEEPRSGIITVTYAGLEASINVVQSPSMDSYLNVTLEETWVQSLSPLKDTSSEYIYVNASGAWTAEIFGDDGFSFTEDGAAKKTLKSDELLTGKFHVYTNSENNDGATRKAFVLISLNEDPVNFVSVVTIYQRPAGKINISPDTDKMLFNGSGTLISHPASTEFTVKSTAGSITEYTLSGLNPDKFNVSLSTGNESGTLIVTPIETNTSGSPYSAFLYITDDEAGDMTISLRQNTLALTVTPSAPGKVVVEGGQTEIMTISTGDASSQWTATINTASTTPGKTLYNHNAYIVDENGNRLNTSEPLSVTQKFKVAFPKVYFPNRGMNIAATVTIQIEGSRLSQTITVNQTALTSKGVKIFNVRSFSATYPYGSLESRYIRAYSNALKSMGYTWSNGSYTNEIVQACPTGTTYAHFANYGIDVTYNFTNLQNFRTGTDGILLMCSEANTISALTNITSPLRDYDLEYNNGSSGGVVLTPGAENTRIGQFLMTHGGRPIAHMSDVPSFFLNETHTSAKSIPATAVKIMQKDSNKNTIMAIDPTNRMVYLGESQVFQSMSSTHPESLKEDFMYNFIDYVINAAKYGSHFTDMLNENIPEDNRPPTPWNSVWGANKWPDNR